MNQPRRGTPDFLFLFLTLVLVAFGLLMVFSASSMSNSFYHLGDSLYSTKRQALSIFLGITGMFICMNLHYSRLKKLSIPIFMVILIMLFLVPFIGVDRNGAKSWFLIGPLQLQPAEFAKLGIILYLAALISKKQEKFRSFKKGLLPALLAVALVSGLIMLQPDLGSTLLIVMGSAIVIIVGGADLRQILFLGTSFGLVGGLGLGLYFLTHHNAASYRLDRFTAFMNPWSDETGSGFQIIQSLYAFGHGGLTGAGFGKSIQKLHYLPEAHNDFIFSIIGEELGFIGAALFLFVYLLFIWRGIIVALRCDDTFGNLIGVGIMGMIGIQALINLGGVTQTIPLTGVTLPLISYGGSSMLVTLTSLGILLGISREHNKLASEQEAIHSAKA